MTGEEASRPISGSMGRCIARTSAGPSGAKLGHGSLPEQTPTQCTTKPRGKCAGPGCRRYFGGSWTESSILAEILVEVAGIPVGAGEACPFRVRIRAGASAAAACASGRLVLDAASLRLPAAVAGIGIRLGFRGRLCSLPGLRTPLAVVVLRTGLGRGLAGLAVVALRTGPGRGLARLAVLVPRPGPRLAVLLVPRPGVAPTHAFGWASVGVDGHGARRPEH